MNNKIFSGIVLFLIFFLLFPICELIFFEKITIALSYFVASQIMAICISFFMCYKFGFFKITNYKSVSFFLDEKHVSKFTFYLGLLFFIFFLKFYLSNVNSVGDVLLFAERYRNGYYKGSGIYTAGMIQFLPLVVTMLIIKLRKLNLYFFMCLALLFLTSLLLGLRIFLLIVLFFLSIRILSSEKRLAALVSLLLLGMFFIFYKLMLSDGLSNQSLTDVLLHIAGRIRYRFLVYDSGFSYGFIDFIGFALPIFPFSDTLAEWKEFFTLSIPDIDNNMPQISKFSGMAFPLTIIVFNVFGLLGFVFIIPFVILFVWSLKRCFESNSIVLSIWALYLVNFSLSILIEDVYQFTKIPLMLVLIFTVMLFFTFSQKINLGGNK